MRGLKKMGIKNKLRKEEDSEDWCFVCKDGGCLTICGHKDCLKAYHTGCLNELDASLMTTEEEWICDWHYCFKCNRAPKFYCLCCPSSICETCLYEVDFAIVQGDKGLCDECLELALLIEENKDVDSYGNKIDFSDPDTKEYYFCDYWRIVKEKECLTSEQVISASNLLKSGENYKLASDSDGFGKGEKGTSRKRKKSKGKQSANKSEFKTSGKEVTGWGSKPLLEFLAFIGEDTTRELSTQAIATIISEYSIANKLLHPEGKNKIICDARLQALFGRKSVKKTGLYKLLTTHLVENLDQSEDIFVVNSSQCEDDNSVACKRQLWSSSVNKYHSKEAFSYETSEAQGAESAGKDSVGRNEQEHNVDIPESPPNRTSEDECQFNTTIYDGVADIEEYNSLLCLSEKSERSNRAMSAKKDKGNAKEVVSLQNHVDLENEMEAMREFSKNMNCPPLVQMELEQPQPFSHGVPEVFADGQNVQSASKLYSRRNRQENSDGLSESSIGRTSNGNGISCHMTLVQPELLNELPVGNVVAQAEPASEDAVRADEQDGFPESSPGKTSNGNEIVFPLPSEQSQIPKQVPVVIAVAEHVEPVSTDDVRAYEQYVLPEPSVGRTEGNAISCHLNYLPNISDIPSFTAASPSQPPTDVYQPEVPEASAPPTQAATTGSKPVRKAINIDLIDDKEERSDINLIDEGQAFFANLQPLLDEFLSDLPGPSQQLLVTGEQINKAKSCFNLCCSMNFEQLIYHAQRDQFLSSINLLLKCGHFPENMLDMVRNLQSDFHNNACLYSQCQQSVKRADKDREHAESLRKGLADKHNLFLRITGDIKVVEDQLQDQRKKLYETEELKDDLVEQGVSLLASSRTLKEDFLQYFKNAEILENCKRGGQQVMEEIDTCWKKFQTEVSKLL